MNLLRYENDGKYGVKIVKKGYQQNVDALRLRAAENPALDEKRKSPTMAPKS
jgi:hypothetical protein